MTFRMQGREIRERAEQLGGGATRRSSTRTTTSITRTGIRPSPPGSKVVSTDRTLAYLRALDADYWEGDAAGTLPNDTFADEHELADRRQDRAPDPPGPRPHRRRPRRALRRGPRAAHRRPVLQRHAIPNIDLEAGGSVQGMGGDARPRARARLRPGDPRTRPGDGSRRRWSRSRASCASSRQRRRGGRAQRRARSTTRRRTPRSTPTRATR